MQEFCRTMWVSKEAQDIWEPRFRAIQKAWTFIERDRILCIQTVGADELPELSAWCAENNRYLHILSINGQSSNAVTRPVFGQKFQYRVAISSTNIAPVTFKDDAWIGDALGYPDCCIEFFENTWNKGYRDTAHLMKYDGKERLYGTNIILRWLGLRVVSHLPCSFSCIRTSKTAERNKERAVSLGFKEQWGHLEQILSWPMEYSTLHGIAIIKTPILEFMHSSDYVHPKHTIKLESENYPLEGASGVKFPYRNRRIYGSQSLQP